MDNPIGVAWGRLASHRRVRSSETGNKPQPIEFTSDGTRYTAEAPAAASIKSFTQHSRSKSLNTAVPEGRSTPSQVYVQLSEYLHYKAAVNPPNPLELRRLNSKAKRSTTYSHKASSSVSSVSTKNSSVTGLSRSSLEAPRQQSLPPQRPPRPARGLWEVYPDEEPVPAPLADATPAQIQQDESIQSLILEADRAFHDVGMALASVTYNSYVAQARPDMLVLNRGNSVKRRRHGLTMPPAPVPIRRSSINSTGTFKRTSAHSSRSSSVKGQAPRQPATKKMGKRNVLHLRKLRWPGVADLIANRGSKRTSASSSLEADYSEFVRRNPSHKRNSSITATKLQSVQKPNRSSTDSKSSSLYASDVDNLTASQMYHRDMLPDSIMEWIDMEAVFTQEPGSMGEAVEQQLSQEFDDKCNIVTESEPTPPPATEMVPIASVPEEADVSSLVADGSPPPPPPKNPARLRARARQSQLPPIPEVQVAASDGERRRRRSSVAKSSKGRRGSTKAKALPRDSLYLVGTAYSKASPLFRHGHIEFLQKGPKADAAAADNAQEEEAGDEVDWLTYHSSIMCDVGDLSTGMAEDESNAIADELGDWFDEFGFESHGELVRSTLSRTARPQSSRSTSSSPRNSAASSSSTISDADLPMPASPDQSPFAKMQGWSFSQAERSASTASALQRRQMDEHCTDPIPVLAEIEVAFPMYGLPSTVEDFSVKKTPRRMSGPAPRMSCNLSEDLGQFLAGNPTEFYDIDEEDE